MSARRRGLRGKLRAGGVARGARTNLRSFRQATILAVAVTALFLLLIGLDAAVQEDVALAQPALPGLMAQTPPAETVPVTDPGEVLGEALGEARQTAADLRDAFFANLPQYLVALAVLLMAWILSLILRRSLGRVLRGWERANAIAALSGVVIWLLALGIAISVLVGDIRALVGSLGLIGLALSWALQNPIESFTGWLMNGMRGYYRVGDRIGVGDVLGDVFRIDFFTTTVWEIGGPERPGVSVTAEQPTGRLITFPNNEVLTGSIVNFTRDFPYVWDELAVPVANESDLPYAVRLLKETAGELLGDTMAGPAETYERILRERRLETSVPRDPQVFVSLEDSWTSITVRYLVNARKRRIWKSRISSAAMEAFNAEEHRERILPVYPRRQIMFVDGRGRPTEPVGR